MSLHVFVDESRRGSLYLVAAALLRPAELGPTRGLMRGLRVPGERRLHFHNERDTVKKDTVSALVAAEVATRVYSGHGQPDAAREHILRALVIDVASAGLRRLVLDSRGPSRDNLDRRTIHAALASTATNLGSVTYEHMRSHEEPVLWLADAVAWCYGAGGDWRRRVQPVVKTVTDLGHIGRRRSRR